MHKWSRLGPGRLFGKEEKAWWMVTMHLLVQKNRFHDLEAYLEHLRWSVLQK